MQTHLGYEPPIADIRFALEELADLGALSKLPEFAHSDQKTVAQLLRECGRFVGEVLTPIDRSGDPFEHVAQAALGLWVARGD